MAQSDGHEAPELIDKAVPSVAAVNDDVVVVSALSVGESVVGKRHPAMGSNSNEAGKIAG